MYLVGFFFLLNVYYVDYKDVDGVSFEICYQPLHIIYGKCTFKYEDISSIRICHNDLLTARDTYCGDFKSIYQMGIGTYASEKDHIFIYQGVSGCVSCCNENKCPKWCHCRPYDPLNPKANGKVLQIELKKSDKMQILPWTTNGCCWQRGVKFNGIILEYYDFVRFQTFLENSKNIKIEGDVDLTISENQENA